MKNDKDIPRMLICYLPYPLYSSRATLQPMLLYRPCTLRSLQSRRIVKLRGRKYDVPLPVADVAGVTVEVEDGGHLLALLPGLLDQE